MSPKKAIIIITILALLVTAVFAYLFIADQNSQRNFLPAAGEREKTSQEIIINKIQEITAKGEREGKTRDEIREEVISEINEYMREIVKNRTPEEKAIEDKKDREREKIIQEFNNSLKNK